MLINYLDWLYKIVNIVNIIIYWLIQIINYQIKLYD
jgi:hypothetical protein